MIIMEEYKTCYDFFNEQWSERNLFGKSILILILPVFIFYMVYVVPVTWLIFFIYEWIYDHSKKAKNETATMDNK